MFLPEPLKDLLQKPSCVAVLRMLRHRKEGYSVAEMSRLFGISESEIVSSLAELRGILVSEGSPGCWQIIKDEELIPYVDKVIAKQELEFVEERARNLVCNAAAKLMAIDDLAESIAVARRDVRS